MSNDHQVDHSLIIMQATDANDVVLWHTHEDCLLHIVMLSIRSEGAEVYCDDTDPTVNVEGYNHERLLTSDFSYTCMEEWCRALCHRQGKVDRQQGGGS